MGRGKRLWRKRRGVEKFLRRNHLGRWGVGNNNNYYFYYYYFYNYNYLVHQYLVSVEKIMRKLPDYGSNPRIPIC
ncbi:hypothetical protein DPMN_055898 [Dreissena polymorpha]|uniref:Uncharacterized protein n=1 Tax=Dreissena polymorpha TaxID=45954 RepID=A0A9D4CTG9_DREPO|nr:hypothetical protein DPMN_055898 [Dreissena polymorpha]